jgi:hypothetical protein
MVTACRALLESSLPQRVDLVLLDTTQLTNPPPRLSIRLVMALRRLAEFTIQILRRRPDAVLLFAAAGLSLLEKGVMARIARTLGVQAILFPRAGSVMDAFHRSRFQRAWMGWAFRGPSKIFCQGDRWRHFFVEVVGRSEKDTPIIPNWTATPALLELGRNRTPRASGPIRLIFVGWL